MILRHATRNSRASASLASSLTWQRSISQCTRCIERPIKSTITSRQQLCSTMRQFTTGPLRYAAAKQHVSEPAELTIAEYHQLSDSYIDSLVESLEELAETNAAIDVEYHSGVLNLVFPPAGTYVINKQPPNRQIWLSSPVSGPKRYDYVVREEGKGDWVYLRDGSTLTRLLNEELKVDFKPPEKG